MNNQNLTHSNRIFKIGTTRITEDPSMAHLTPDQVRALLQHQFPEVANATVRETTLDDGTKLVEYLVVPGRKG
jgi:hypothetical protein